MLGIRQYEELFIRQEAFPLNRKALSLYYARDLQNA